MLMNEWIERTNGIALTRSNWQSANCSISFIFVMPKLCSIERELNLKIKRTIKNEKIEGTVAERTSYSFRFLENEKYLKFQQRPSFAVFFFSFHLSRQRLWAHEFSSSTHFHPMAWFQSSLLFCELCGNYPNSYVCKRSPPNVLCLWTISENWRRHFVCNKIDMAK